MNNHWLGYIMLFFSLFACGLTLIVLSGFRWSWGWWL